MFKPPYDDSIKAFALTMLDTAGYPHKPGALQLVARATGISASTLRRWALACADGRSPLAHPTGAGPLSPETDASPLPQAIRTEMLAILHSMADARPEASYKELSAGFAVLADKLKVLDEPGASTSEFGPGDAKERLARMLGVNESDQ
jgi:hypothetical protein